MDRPWCRSLTFATWRVAPRGRIRPGFPTSLLLSVSSNGARLGVAGTAPALPFPGETAKGRAASAAEGGARIARWGREACTGSGYYSAPRTAFLRVPTAAPPAGTVRPPPGRVTIASVPHPPASARPSSRRSGGDRDAATLDAHRERRGPGGRRARSHPPGTRRRPAVARRVSSTRRRRAAL